MGGRQSRKERTKGTRLLNGAESLVATSSPQLRQEQPGVDNYRKNTKDCRKCVALILQLAGSCQWSQAITVSQGFLMHLEQQFPATKTVDIHIENAVEMDLVDALLHASTVCNRLLQTHLGERYLKVATQLSLNGTLIRPMLYQLQTHCFHADCDSVLARIQEQDVQGYLLGNNGTDRSRAEHVEVMHGEIQQLLLDVARSAFARKDYGSVALLLMDQTFDSGKTGPNSFLVQCERDTMLVCSKYVKRDIVGQEMTLELDRVRVQWYVIDWPLPYADIIAELLYFTAVHHLEERRAKDAACVAAELKNLHRHFWREQNLLVAETLYRIGDFAAYETNKYHVGIECGEMALQILEEITIKSCDQDFLKLTMAAICYLLGATYQTLGQVERVEQNFKQAIELLESVAQTRELHAKYPRLLTSKLVQVYSNMAELLFLHHGHTKQYLQYRRRALQYQTMYNPHDNRREQALLADALHCIGAMEEAEGNSREANYLFSEAEETFAGSVEDSTEEYEPFAYGYFLYCRKRFLEARKLMLKTYSISFSSVLCMMFSQHERHVLTEELKFEVQHSSGGVFMVPTKLAALYFYVMSLVNEADSDKEEVEHFLDLFVEQTERCNYSGYAKVAQLHTVTSEATLICSSYSLLGYAHRALSRNEDALHYFQMARAESTDCAEAANLNISKLKTLNLCARETRNET